MKDWKTYAIVALAAWCAWLTFRSPQETVVMKAVTTECVDEKCRAMALGAEFAFQYGVFAKDSKEDINRMFNL